LGNSDTTECARVLVLGTTRVSHCSLDTIGTTDVRLWQTGLFGLWLPLTLDSWGVPVNSTGDTSYNNKNQKQQLHKMIRVTTKDYSHYLLTFILFIIKNSWIINEGENKRKS